MIPNNNHIAIRNSNPQLINSLQNGASEAQRGVEKQKNRVSNIGIDHRQHRTDINQFSQNIHSIANRDVGFGNRPDFTSIVMPEYGPMIVHNEKNEPLDIDDVLKQGREVRCMANNLHESSQASPSQLRPIAISLCGVIGLTTVGYFVYKYLDQEPTLNASFSSLQPIPTPLASLHQDNMISSSMGAYQITKEQGTKNSLMVELDTVSTSSTADKNDAAFSSTEQFLINQWTEWAKNASDGIKEQRNTALMKLQECLKLHSEVLDLSGLNLTDVSISFPNHIKRLILTNNRLTSLPDDLPPALSVLDMSHNQFTSLPDNLPPTLTMLTAKNNQLTFLPENLPPELRMLTVSDNQLRFLPKNLPANMSVMFIENNKLERLPDNLPPEMTWLDAKNNTLKQIPVNLPNKMNTLELDYNGLITLPDNLPTVLMTLKVCHNNLTRLPDHLPDRLFDLFVSHNQLNTLPQTWPFMLGKLNVSYNQLTSQPKNLPVGIEVDDSHNLFNTVS